MPTIPAPDHAHPTGSSVGVVIVDDHETYRSIATEVVHASSGFELIGAASDRVEALEIIEARRDAVDLVLMDVCLGDDDGVDLTRELLADRWHPDILLVTTLTIDELPAAARSCGARGYLPKESLSPSTLSDIRRGVYDWRDVTSPHRSRR